MPEQGYEWPHPYQCAMTLTVDVDAVAPMMWRLRGKKQHPLAEEEIRRFGLRQGVGRILDVLSELAMPATFFVPAYVAENSPRIISRIIAEGHELGLHGYLHEDVESLTETENREVLEKSIRILDEVSGRVPVGYRSPSWTMTRYLPRLLKESGVEYDSSLMGYDHPYTIEDLTEVPVTWTADDATYFFYTGPGDVIAPPWPADQVERAWRDEIAAAKQFGSYVSLTVHPWLTGRGHRALVLRRLLEEVKSDPAIWAAPCREIAAYHANSSNQQNFSVQVGASK